MYRIVLFQEEHVSTKKDCSAGWIYEKMCLKMWIPTCSDNASPRELLEGDKERSKGRRKIKGEVR